MLNNIINIIILMRSKETWMWCRNKWKIDWLFGFGDKKTKWSRFLYTCIIPWIVLLFSCFTLNLNFKFAIFIDLKNCCYSIFYHLSHVELVRSCCCRAAKISIRTVNQIDLVIGQGELWAFNAHSILLYARPWPLEWSNRR